MDLKNDGPVSVNYSSHDEVVPKALFCALSCPWPSLTVFIQVTLEIETKPMKTQDKAAGMLSQKSNRPEPETASLPMESVD